MQTKKTTKNKPHAATSEEPESSNKIFMGLTIDPAVVAAVKAKAHAAEYRSVSAACEEALKDWLKKPHKKRRL